jgi:hypothetical protein
MDSAICWWNTSQKVQHITLLPRYYFRYDIRYNFKMNDKNVSTNYSTSTEQRSFVLIVVVSYCFQPRN